jgi:hypothetical protein
MDAANKEALERLRSAAERHRRLASLHEALGELCRAADCMELAELEETRAERLERRLFGT